MPSFSGRVIAWQRAHGRHGLPWQGTRDPYRIWLSEVMLQQTQVGTVLAYFARFVECFPDVRALAAAPLDDVLAAWSGLGYYGRARHLHRCAQVVVAQYGGEFPRRADALSALPGIGRSTAAAIAAFAFGERAAILDGNVKRVLTRVLGFGADLSVAANERALWREADALLPRRGVDVYTQGLMDLGATVCVKRRPRCDVCPLAASCVARVGGEPERYPVKTRRSARGRRDSALLVLAHRDAVWLTRRPPRGVWAGLWSLPEFASRDELQRLTQDWPGEARVLEPIEHALTHFDWRLEPVRHELPQRDEAIERTLPPGSWFARGEALRLGLPAPVRRLLEST